MALNYAVAGGWSTAFRRIPEAMAAVLPFGAAGIAAVLLFHPSLYPWAAPGFHAEGFKHVWLSRPFFLVRAAVYLLLWMGFARLIVNRSRAQDRDGTLAHTHANVRLSVGFLVVFAHYLLARQLRLDHVARAALGQHHFRRLQLRRHVHGRCSP